MTARTVWCRPIRHGPHARCGCCRHSHRLLAAVRDSLGRRVADWCLNCGARTAWITYDDLRSADIWPLTLPTVETLPDGRKWIGIARRVS